MEQNNRSEIAQKNYMYQHLFERHEIENAIYYLKSAIAYENWEQVKSVVDSLAQNAILMRHIDLNRHDREYDSVSVIKDDVIKTIAK
jgi:hypothetical protein